MELRLRRVKLLPAIGAATGMSEQGAPRAETRCEDCRAGFMFGSWLLVFSRHTMIRYSAARAELQERTGRLDRLSGPFLLQHPRVS